MAAPLEFIVKLKIQPFLTFKRKVDSNIDNPHISKMYEQWAVRYRAFIQRRFNRYSRGGGDWPKLKPATLRRRRKGSRSVAILQDTRQMYMAMNPTLIGAAGQFQERIEHGIRVGFGGVGTHRKAKMPVAVLADIHHSGKGNVPARKIIVEPDDTTTEAMMKDMERAYAAMAKEGL